MISFLWLEFMHKRHSFTGEPILSLDIISYVFSCEFASPFCNFLRKNFINLFGKKYPRLLHELL